jgi:hypothetical protein
VALPARTVEVPERLHERFLHDVVGLLPRAEQEGGPVCAQRVPGDQHGIGVKVAVAGTGYRLRVVDGSPHSNGRTHPEYTAGGRRVLLRGVLTLVGPSGATSVSGRLPWRP